MLTKQLWQWRNTVRSKPYTCNECPAFLEGKEEIDKWRKIASEFYYAVTNQGSIVDALLSYEEAKLGE
jgi:hypothetical protein